MVETNSKPLEKPKNLVEHIENFENGQVYEIIQQNNSVVNQAFNSILSQETGRV